MIARLVTLAGLLIALAAPLAPVQAQEVERIAAVVNDEIISVKDLAARVRMALMFSNMPDNQENRRRAIPQVLRKMIDERLQMQEANRLKIAVTAADLDAGVGLIEKNNRLPPGGLTQALNQQGIPVTAMRDQIRVDLTWMRLTGRVLQGQVRVGEDEITDRLELLRDRAGKPEFLAAEIFLPVDQPSQEEEMKKLGEDLLGQLRQGAPFAGLAGQFSRSPTAANGGQMGWVAEGGLEDELAQALSELTKGQLSGLVRTGSGYYILAKLDQRIAGTSVNPEDSEVTLSQVLLPTPPGSPPKEQLLSRAAQLTRPAKTCDELESMGRRLGAATIGTMGTKRVGELPANLRRAVIALPVNRASEPLDTAEGVQVVMVCKRTDNAQVSAPSREQVRRQIEDERLDMLSRRYIRDLRRAAFVDIRI